MQLHYAHAPNGNDPGSQFARAILAHAAKLTKLSNRKNAVGGNIGRVVRGWAPAHAAAYGYRYRAEREIAPDARVIIKGAWWEVNELGPDGQPLYRSPAWVVRQIFDWVGGEGRSLHWVVNKLNDIVRGCKDKGCAGCTKGRVVGWRAVLSHCQPAALATSWPGILRP